MKLKQDLKIKGEHYFFSINPSIKKDSFGFKILEQAIQNYIRRGKEDALKYLVDKKLIVGVVKHENLIANVGKNVLARILAGDTTYTGEINYGALGSGDTAFTSASTKLNTEVYRMIPSSQSYDGAVVYIDFFIASGDVADQTFKEWGTFIDGTASADSGQAFSLMIGDIVKSGSIYVSSKYTLV